MHDPQALEAGVETLPGVGPTLAKRLGALGIGSVADLLLHRPRRYERAADEITISQLWGNEEVVITGVVQDVKSRRLATRRSIVTAVVRDDSGSISATWFNQPWLLEKLTPGTHVRLRGRLGRYGFDVKSYDIGDLRATADFAPVYPASEAVPSTRLRELVRATLSANLGAVHETLPAELELPLRRDALGAVHFPISPEQAEEARRRLALDELVALQLVVARSHRHDAVAVPLAPPGELLDRYREALPFELTTHQQKAIGEIDSRPRPRRADAAAAAGRRRLGQDRRRALCAAPGCRGWAAGGADGPDGDARRAAFPDARAAVRDPRRAVRPAHRLGRLREGAGRDRLGRGADRGRHARA